MTVTNKVPRQAARSAFTLMEMLIVVAIIVVLAGVGAYYLLPQLEKSKEDAAHLKAKEIEKAVTTFYTRYDRWPSLEELTQPVQTNSGTDRALMDPEGIVDPWGKAFTLDTSGPNHQGNAPDIYTTAPSGKVVGNWNPKR